MKAVYTVLILLVGAFSLGGAYAVSKDLAALAFFCGCMAGTLAALSYEAYREIE